MGKTGWNEVDRERGGDSKFLQVSDGETKTVRFLDNEPFTVLVHQVRGQVGEQNVFRSVPATERPDDDWIDKQTNRFQPVARHALRCIEIDDDGEIQGIRVLEGGVQIFRPLKAAFLRYGNITDYDFTVERRGEGRDTEWDVKPSPDSFDIDLEEWLEELGSDDSLSWEALYPPVTPEEQQKIVEESGIDITYDPVAALAEQMDLEEALGVRLTFGKFGPDKCPPHGLTVGEAFEIEPQTIAWYAENITSNDTIAAACRVVTTEKTVGPGKKKKALTSGDKKPKAKAPPQDDPEEDEDGDEVPTRDDWKGSQSVEDYLARWFGQGGKKVDLALAILGGEGKSWPPESEDDDDEPEDAEDDAEDDDGEGVSRDDLMEEITEILSDGDFDTTDIIAMVKKFSGGSAKMRDMDEAQLIKMRDHLKSGGDDESEPTKGSAPAKKAAKKATAAPAKKAAKKAVRKR